MLYARTQAGDHGHPRASARVGPSVDSRVKNIQKDTHVNLEIQLVTAKGSLGIPSRHGDVSVLGNTELGNPTGHRQGATWTSKQPLRLFDSERYRMLYARTQAGDNGHPRSCACMGIPVSP